MINQGVFCISLDFELHWGCFERMVLNEAQQQYFLNTRLIIPEKLKLFEDNGIHATWAIVGMLYNKNVTEWEMRKPSIIPTFSNERASAYKWIEKYGFKGEEDPYHFAPELINKIKETKFQEIGTHTYAHYFCLEPGQTIEQFKEDLALSIKVANENGTEIKSMVFPRNQINSDYLSVCFNLGIKTLRTSPDIWYWRYGTGYTFKERFFRAGDAYIKMQSIKPVFLKDLKFIEGLPLMIPASRLYRSWQSKYKIQNPFKIRRILNEMTEAAKSGAYYHLWWHPHNFGENPKECMEDLIKIVAHYKKLNKKYSFISKNMQEVNEMVLGIS